MPGCAYCSLARVARIDVSAFCGYGFVPLMSVLISLLLKVRVGLRSRTALRFEMLA